MIPIDSFVGQLLIFIRFCWKPPLIAVVVTIGIAMSLWYHTWSYALYGIITISPMIVFLFFKYYRINIRRR